jgi:prepilin-type N-terminal cleavage/methylation domain-containing protein
MCGEEIAETKKDRENLDAGVCKRIDIEIHSTITRIDRWSRRLVMRATAAKTERKLPSFGDVPMGEAGFTLVEVMVVSAIMLVLALGLATMFTDAGRHQKTIEVKGNIVQLSNGIRGLASTPGAIENSMLTTD